jgi:hypothetical protein
MAVELQPEEAWWFLVELFHDHLTVREMGSRRGAGGVNSSMAKLSPK